VPQGAHRMLRLAELGRAQREEWLSSLRSPGEHQARALRQLLPFYSRTRYGRERGLSPSLSYGEYASRSPVTSYRELEPLIARELGGDRGTILGEEVVAVGVTSGTSGEPKLIPITPTDLTLRMKVMLAGVAHISERFGSGALSEPLIVRFPTCVYAESSLKFCHTSGLLELVLRSLLTGIPVAELLEAAQVEPVPEARGDYARLFEATYESFKDLDLRLAVGSAPALLLFAWHLRRRHSLLPKDLWDVRVIMATGVPYIHDFYEEPLLRAYGDQASVIELYGATEALIAMQAGEEPYVSPFYNCYPLEVETGCGVKPLHELESGEVGALVVSTPALPRYRLGDLVECVEEGRLFKVHGRSTLATRLRVSVERLLGRVLDTIAKAL